jgi:small subunit ribosomal protein S4e
MLDKLGGVFAPKPSSGPHKTRECLPMIIFLRNRLKYALTYVEARKICKQRLIKIDGRVRTDFLFPAGFMGLLNERNLFSKIFIWIYLDVISIEKTGENFRLIYDVKGRFCVHRITAEEAKVGLEHNREIDMHLMGMKSSCLTIYVRRSDLSIECDRYQPKLSISAHAYAWL